MIIRGLLTLLLQGILVMGAAQVRVDAPIVLDGPDAGDRQVIGLRDAAAEDEAVNARTLRDAPYRYAEVSNTADWQVELDPPLSEVTTGTALMIRSTAGSAGPVTLTVDGQGPYPLLKGNGTALEAGDIGAGETAYMVFDGTAFQLVGARRLAKRPCPPNAVEVNPLYCIEIAETDSMTFSEAAVVCGERNGRLCTWGEWHRACVIAQSLGLQQISGNYEWTNSAANGDGNVRVVGSTACSAVGTGPAFTAPGRPFRCCYRH